MLGHTPVGLRCFKALFLLKQTTTTTDQRDYPADDHLRVHHPLKMDNHIESGKVLRSQLFRKGSRLL